MSRPLYRQRWSWVEGRRTVRQEKIPGVQSAEFALSILADRGLLTTRQLADFQDATGLADMAWRIFWNRTALIEAGDDYRSLLRRTQGFIIFMHGWDANGDVWDHLPALTCAANPRLVALTPDLNGFGGSPFLAELPALEQCAPHAVMRSVVHLVNMLGLRSSVRARRRRRVITFVGHSMSGAALFYFQRHGWHDDEFARCAVAPVLLINEDLRQGFYQTFGVDRRSSRSANGLEKLKSRLTPSVVENLVRGASAATRANHLRIFETTPKGTLIQTFDAMGATWNELNANFRRNFRIILAHGDQVLDVSRMLACLDEMGFGADHAQVVWGDHYLFSVGEKSRRVHMRNREVVLGEILHLHERCRENQ